ncbi:MAG TPA: hypothetical protein VGB57_00085 [Allosphingosinicella sp.]
MRGQAVLRAAVLPGLLGDGEVELEHQRRQVPGREPKQPADGREAEPVEPLEPFLQRVGGKLAPLRRQEPLLRLESRHPGLGPPQGRDRPLQASPGRAPTRARRSRKRDRRPTTAPGDGASADTHA